MKVDVTSVSGSSFRLLPRSVGAALIVLVLAPGCAVLSKPSQEPPRFEVEVETVEQQALGSVSATPLEFTVPLNGSDEAWARALLFFSQYTSAAGAPREVAPRTVQVTSEGDSPDLYRYSVRRVVTPHGYRFTVECTPNGERATPFLAERNGRNLARFIREGTLEVSLLARE